MAAAQRVPSSITGAGAAAAGACPAAPPLPPRACCLLHAPPGCDAWPPSMRPSSPAAAWGVHGAGPLLLVVVRCAAVCQLPPVSRARQVFVLIRILETLRQPQYINDGGRHAAGLATGLFRGGSYERRQQL
jgi:hypothetical protein